MIENHKEIVRKLEPEVRRIGETLADKVGKVEHSQKLHSYDLLTTFDTEVEEALRNNLSLIDPNTPVVGEESGGDRMASRYWLVDPIDGTIHFIRGNPFCTMMLALIEDEKPVIGIIYNFSTKEFYSAIKGKGSYLNGKTISVSNRNIDSAVVLAEINTRKPGNEVKLNQIIKHTKMMNLVCAGYEFAMIADGRAEARVCIDPFGKDYDFAAGSLIVQEAGGVVKTLSGSDYDVSQTNFIVASSEQMYYDIKLILDNDN